MEPVGVVESMDSAAKDRLMLALTTKHFTLETARPATISESAGRAALFLFKVSSGIVALAFGGQSPGLGPAFDLLALTVLPVLVLLGPLTYLRLVQSAVEDPGRSFSRTRQAVRGPRATARGARVSHRRARHEFVTSEGDRAGMRLHRLLVPAAILVVVAALAVPASSAPGDIASKRQQVAELDRELSAVDAEAGAAAAAHNAALDRRDAVATRIGETRTEVRLTTRQLRSSRERLGERMVALYVREPPDPFEALLQSGDLADVLAVTDLLERTAASDAAVVAKVKERRQALERLRARLAADAVVAGRELAEAQSQRRRVEALLDTRRRALEGAREELGTLLAAERARLARLAARKKEAQEEARRAAATSVASPSVSPGPASPSAGAASAPVPGGSHVYPLAGPSTFGDDWLASRPGGRYHEGIDLFAARGTPVVAVADGTLFRVGYSGISGNRFWLRDEGGTEFFYAHLDGYTAAAREGAAVAKGTVLGYNGDTGDARGTSPHVHFEIHPGGGGPVRPYPIVSAWPRVG